MSEKIWRGGMIGAGAWSEVQLNAWAGVKNAKIVALADRHPDRRDPVIQKFGIPQAYDDFVTMLDKAELDFVDICTRPYSHKQLTKLAADRKLPVICQKPFCQSLTEAYEVHEICQKAGIRLMVNENFRWLPFHRKVKELLDTGIVGKPFFARFYQRRRLSLPRFNHNQVYFKEMPQLLLYEVGTHLLDTSRYIFGDPSTVYARLHHESPEVIGEDVQVLVLAYPEMTLVIHDSWASVPVPETDRAAKEQRFIPRLLEIEGTDGTLVIKPDGSIHLYTDQDHKSWEIGEGAGERSATAAQQHFIDCLESGKEFETNALETIKTMGLVYACYESAKAGRVVTISDFMDKVVKGTTAT
jgi:D-apiose dehydrogenase